MPTKPKWAISIIKIDVIVLQTKILVSLIKRLYRTTLFVQNKTLNMPIRIMHLTWGETPRSYGVFGSQVISQFVATRRAITQAEFLFASGLPIIHSGMTREKLGYFAECRKIKEVLEDIPFKILPIYAPQNLINSSSFTFQYLHGISHWHLYKLIKQFAPDVIHCRSYHAAWAALSVRRRSNFGYKIIFDGRGLYPEEVSLKKGYTDVSVDYKYLKNIEHELLTECDLTIAVSKPMEKHYRKLGAKNCQTIYLSADAKRLKPFLLEDRKCSSLKFCYVGALSEDTWHKTSELLRLFKRIRELIPNALLTVVTTSDHNAVKSFFNDFSEDEVSILQTNTLDQLKSILQQSDFGLLSYFKPTTAREIMLAEMVLAVKTAEYLCSGLPIIVNRYCAGASTITTHHNLGLVYDPCNLNALKAEDILSRVPSTERRKVIASTAHQLFDYAKHATDYANLYKDLINAHCFD